MHIQSSSPSLNPSHQADQNYDNPDEEIEHIVLSDNPPSEEEEELAPLAERTILYRGEFDSIYDYFTYAITQIFQGVMAGLRALWQFVKNGAWHIFCDKEEPTSSSEQAISDQSIQDDQSSEVVIEEQD